MPTPEAAPRASSPAPPTTHRAAESAPPVEAPETFGVYATTAEVEGLARWDRRAGLVLLVCGLLGAAAALVLAVEKFRVLTNPFYVPSCSVNEKISCLSVMTSPQAELLGFPNPLIGLLAFGALTAAAAAVLASPRMLAGWFWSGMQAGTTAGLVFVHWLAWQSSVVIGALCPYCMAVWTVTITAFTYVTARNLAARHGSQQTGPGPGGAPVAQGSLARSPAVVCVVWVLLLLSAAIAATLLGRA